MALVGAALVFAASPALGHNLAQGGSKLTPGGTGSRFGDSTAVSGDATTAIVSSYAEPFSHVYRSVDGVWAAEEGPMPTGGWSVALSADGNTAVVGLGYGGAAEVWVRGPPGWVRQATLSEPANGFGLNVAVSSDGNAAVIGSQEFSSGRAYIYTRSNGAWTRQAVLTDPTPTYGDEFGYHVALSGNGNTAAVTAYSDESNAGSITIFTRQHGLWSQQGGKLLATEEEGKSRVGLSVDLSQSGNTLISGGPEDAASAGAAWVFTRVGGSWSQQAKIKPPAGAYCYAGISVALSRSGKKAVIGGFNCTEGRGQAWLYASSAKTWRLRQELTPTETTGQSEFGYSASLSGNGAVALIGGPGDDEGVGAGWVFATP